MFNIWYMIHIFCIQAKWRGIRVHLFHGTTQYIYIYATSHFIQYWHRHCQSSQHAEVDCIVINTINKKDDLIYINLQFTATICWEIEIFPFWMGGKHAFLNVEVMKLLSFYECEGMSRSTHGTKDDFVYTYISNIFLQKRLAYLQNRISFTGYEASLCWNILYIDVVLRV